MNKKGLDPNGRPGTVGYVGGCWMVRMTEELRDGLHVNIGDAVKIVVKDGKIIIEKV